MHTHSCSLRVCVCLLLHRNDTIHAYCSRCTYSLLADAHVKIYYKTIHNVLSAAVVVVVVAPWQRFSISTYVCLRILRFYTYKKKKKIVAKRNNNIIYNIIYIYYTIVVAVLATATAGTAVKLSFGSGSCDDDRIAQYCIHCYCWFITFFSVSVFA